MPSAGKVVNPESAEEVQRGSMVAPSPLSRRDARVAETRQALVSAGRALFGALGFAATSVDDLARHAGVTTGALYHHFATKADLFQTVFELLEAELSERSNEVAREAKGPLDGLKRGFEAFLDASLEPEIQHIVLVDAPAVLGIDRYHEIDEKYAHAPILAALRAAAREGSIDATDLDVLAQLLLGALMQGGMLIARAADQRRARSAVGKSLRRLLDGLRHGAPNT
jgi:AcrR family transcriptional regulator